jgi:predicted Zn-dependent protease
MVFPFREETVPVMQWAMKQSLDWKSRYYLAMIYAFRNQKQKALLLLENGNTPENFAPYYVLRARLYGSVDVNKIEMDLSTAQKIDKNDWRYGKYLTEFLLSQKQFNSALQVIEPYYKKDPENDMTALLYIRCLMLNNNYGAAEKLLENVNILPHEGAKDAHNYYEQTKLMLALEYLKKHNYKLALRNVKEARLWPENLGAGAPYPDMINNNLEDEIQKLINQTEQGQKLPDGVVETYLKKIGLKGSKDRD